MNAIVSTILWVSAQVALFSFAGSAAFLLLRRRGPTTAVTAAVAVLVATLVLSLFALSPWPHWTLRRVAAAANKPAPAARTQDISLAENPSPAVPLAQPSESILQTWFQSAADWYEAHITTPVTPATAPAWNYWLLTLLAIGVALGLARLATGIWAVRTLQRRSHPIDDAALSAAIDQLSNELRLHSRVDRAQRSSSGVASSVNDEARSQTPHKTRSTLLSSSEIQLRQCDLLRSPATVGWRRPLILLPADWRCWTDLELRVVLAHELAHIARRDYLTSILARIVTAIHFYQPLVLWLSRQLRVQQELAADSHAAAITGDRQTYLATLAQMALRADEQPLPWAARAFLPGTSLLIKRVAWLKRRGQKAERSLSRTGGFVLAIAIAAIAIGVAGIRGPSGNGPIALAADPEPTKTAPAPPGNAGQEILKLQGGIVVNTKPLRDLSFVPADAKFVAAMSPTELFKSSATAGVVPMIDAETSGKFGLKFSELADLEAIMSPEHNQRIVLRATAPHDWKATLDKLYPTGLEKRSFAGHDYYFLTDNSQRNKAGDLGPAYYLPDDRTIVAGPEEQIQKIIGGNEQRMDAATFPEFATSAFALRIDVPSIKEESGINSKQLEQNPLLALVLPLIQRAKVARLGVAPTGADPANKDKVAARLTLVCDSPEGAGDVAKSLDATRTFAINVIQAKQRAWQEAASTGAPPEVTKIVTAFVPALEKSLRDAKIASDGAVVSADGQIDIGAPTIAAMVLPALAASKEAAMRTMSMNNLKQLALAMFVYDSSKGHFPAAAIVGPDGKTRHSWRIDVLPYLEQLALYEQYHMDEPWDSENNKKLIDKMPAFFRDPHDDPNSTSSAYYMIAGKGTVGDEGEGTKLPSITDGTSMTIMLVDAKRDVPWTKPDDIEIDPDPAKPLPKLGGHMPDGNFGAAFADGHVEILKDSLNPKILRALFTISGGEVIDRNELDKPAAQKHDLPRELKSY